MALTLIWIYGINSDMDLIFLVKIQLFPSTANMYHLVSELSCGRRIASVSNETSTYTGNFCHLEIKSLNLYSVPYWILTIAKIRPHKGALKGKFICKLFAAVINTARDC